MNKKYVSIGAIVLVVLLGIVFWGQNKGGEEALNNENTENVGNVENKDVKPGTQTTTSRPKTTTTGKTTNTTNTGTQTPLPTQPAVTIPTMAQLDGAIFELKSYNGVPVDPNSRYKVSFSQDSLSAKFCNTLSGAYLLSDGVIKAGNLVGTKMYCGTPTNLMDIETSFTSMLNFGGKISYSDNILILSDTKTIMMFTGFID